MTDDSYRTGRLIVVTATVLVAVAALGAAAVAGPLSTTTGESVAESEQMPALAGVAAAQSRTGGDSEAHVSGSPDIDVAVADRTLQRGTDTVVSLQVLNSGDVESGMGDSERVTTARGVSVSATPENEDAPIEVTTGTVGVGSVGRSAPASAPVTVSVPPDAEPGTYELAVDVAYGYTDTYAPQSNVRSESSDTETTEVTVVVEEGPRFRIVDADTDAPVGGEGNLTLTVENVGEVVAEDARLTAGGETIQTGSVSQVVGEWAPGETKTLAYDATVASDAQAVSQELTATVEYTDESGDVASSRPLVTGVTPAPEHEFDIADVDSTLSVGDDGRVTMTLQNDGPEAVDGVVVRTTSGEALGVAGDEYAVGDLGAGETATVAFETTVGASVDPGPRLLTLAVEYRAGGERRSATQEVTVAVEPASDEFSVEIINGTATAGSSEQLEIAVTNEREQAISDVSAKLFGESPLSATDDEAFVSALGPGETATLQFEYRVSGSALAKTYPVALDFQYEDHRGETRMSETYRVPVDVDQPDEGGGVPASILFVGGFTTLGGAGLVYRRRFA